MSSVPSSVEHPEQQENAGRPPPHQPGWEETKRSTLLKVAILIAALMLHRGTNIPGGYWRDNKDGHHVAGDPIMRDNHPTHYWVFITVCWMGFISSMIMMVYLLTGVPVKSRRVRWSFAVAYSSIMAAFIFSQPGTKIVRDLALWVFVMLIVWIAISFKRWKESFGRRAPLDRMKKYF